MTDMSAPACALMALRAPLPGRVKTRLAAGLGPGDADHDAALALYRAFVADELAALDSMRDGAGLPVTVFVHPPDAVEECEDRLRRPCLPQRGADLGERMAGAFQWAFEAGAGAALMVGGDLPELSSVHLNATLAALDDPDPAGGIAIAPSLDGGYSLIAFTRQAFTPRAFSGIDWGTPRVLEQTLSRLGAAGLAPRLLPVLPDIDTADDLAALAKRWRGRSSDHPGRPAHTLAAMRELGLFQK